MSKTVSYNDYAKSILGEEKYNELLRQSRDSYGHNLFTKKWTKGRTKDFYKLVAKEIRKETRKNSRAFLNGIRKFRKKGAR